MSALSAHQILAVWEAAAMATPIERAIAMAAAAPDATREAVAALPVGQLDARLLEIYRGNFGPQLDLFASCPRCGEEIELSVSVRQLLAAPPATAQPIELERGDLRLRLRVPCAGDLLAIVGQGDAEAARRQLLSACLIEASRDGQPLTATDLDSEESAWLAERLAAADPRAEVLLRLVCPACEHAWRAPLDIAGTVWHELEIAARRVLREVHLLARSYGWNEAEVLALTPARRRAYLEMALS